MGGKKKNSNTEIKSTKKISKEEKKEEIVGPKHINVKFTRNDFKKLQLACGVMKNIVSYTDSKRAFNSLVADNFKTQNSGADIAKFLASIPSRDVTTKRWKNSPPRSAPKSFFFTDPI